MPVLNTLIAVAAAALMVAQAPVPRVEEVDLMAPAPQQVQAPTRQEPPPPQEKQPPAAPPKAAGTDSQPPAPKTEGVEPKEEQPAALPLRSEGKTSTQRIAAFWFILPGGDS
jgi:hypothetical protein